MNFFRHARARNMKDGDDWKRGNVNINYEISSDILCLIFFGRLLSFSCVCISYEIFEEKDCLQENNKQKNKKRFKFSLDF